MSGRREAGRWILLWLLGLDLRVTVLALAPVLPAVTRQLHLDHAAVGALANLPVLLFGVGAALGSFVVGRLGTRRAILVGLVMAAAGGALRGVGASVPVLFGCTFVMGLGIAVFQPGLPLLVREWRPHGVGAATAVYGNGLLAGETLAAALTLTVVLRITGSWAGSLAFWSGPLALTAVVALLHRSWHDPPTRSAPGPAAEPAVAVAPLEVPVPLRAAGGAVGGAAGRGRSWPNLADPRTWRLGLVQGGTSTAYFGVNAFLPGYLHAIGRGGLVGPALTVLNVSQLPASVLVFVRAERLVRHRWALPLLSAAAVAISAGMLVSSSPAVLLVLAGLLGFSTALMLLLVLALPPVMAPARDVARVTAGMFTIGYSIAFLLPLLAGLASDATGSVRVTLAPALIGAGFAAVAATSLRPDRAAPAPAGAGGAGARAKALRDRAGP